jgi:hypothetical protein
MKFYISYDDKIIEIDADNAIQAIIRLIDSVCDVSSNAEFKVMAYSVPGEKHAA